ncbi:unnamed protein product [Ixodes hexagonus]
MATAKCPSCGEVAALGDAGDGVSEACTLCGAVFESCVFQSGVGEEGGSYVPPTETTKLALCPGGLRLVRNKPLRGHRLECDRWLQHAAGRFAMNTAMTQRARDLYQELARRAALPTHVSLAAACCYKVLREEGRAVSLHSLASAAQCTGGQLRYALRLLSKGTGVHPEGPPLRDLVPEAARVLPSDVRESVASRARALLVPLARCWFLEGRSPHCLLPALVFVAWRSLDPQHAQLSYREFCRKHSVEPSGGVSRSLSQLNKVLVRLASQIPWVRGTRLTPNKAASYVPDILRYSASLTLGASAPADAAAKQGPAVAVFRTFRKDSVQSQEEQSRAPEEPLCEDFSDSEIEAYIRGEDEVAAIQKFLRSRGVEPP